MLGATVAELVHPGPVLQIGLMDNAGGHKGLDRAIDGHAVGGIGADPFGDLVAGQRNRGGDEGIEYGQTRSGAAKTGGGQEDLRPRRKVEPYV